MGDPADLLIQHLNGRHSAEPVEGCQACTARPAVSAPEPRPARKDTGSVPDLMGALKDSLDAVRKGDATSPTTGRKCKCGCGADVARRYKPGHDAKHKSQLLREARDKDCPWRAAAVRELQDLGWDHFI